MISELRQISTFSVSSVFLCLFMQILVSKNELRSRYFLPLSGGGLTESMARREFYHLRRIYKCIHT